MQFSAQEDIDVPIETVFTMVSDFERFERKALRRGVDVRRVTGSVVPQAGITWETEFKIRGKPRHIIIEMTECDRPSLMRFRSSSKGMNGDTVIELLALSQRRTRLRVETSLGAKTLPARLLLQSLKLGQSRFRRQFQTRLSEFARDMEERHLHGV